VLPPGENQFEAIYHFYTETIKSTIGLRGYGLQLKVEKAASIDDFRALRQAYLEAVLKAKGNEMARSLRSRLDQLLYLGESGPPTTIIGTGISSPE
jgi:NaMN:DMB phosphoribosyltransferase